MSGTAEPQPYRSTPVFKCETLPDALRRAHSTKAGVWGLLKVLKGSLVYTIEETSEQQLLHAPQSVVIVPQQLHSVEPLEDMEMQVEFYDTDPTVQAGKGRSKP